MNEEGGAHLKRAKTEQGRQQKSFRKQMYCNLILQRIRNIK